ncbi:hypothetical protein HDU76_013850 [Blyttiomyces sp. JEL0837]|nr:hypothetical protein HDU76_013850 [Blyttiomyces sp. JEL0837]
MARVERAPKLEVLQPANNRTGNFQTPTREVNWEELARKNDAHNFVSTYRSLKNAKVRFRSKYQEHKLLDDSRQTRVSISIRKSDDTLVVCKILKRPKRSFHIDPKTGRVYPFEIHVTRQVHERYPQHFLKFYEDFDFPCGRFAMTMQYPGDDWMDLYYYSEKFGPHNEQTAIMFYKKCTMAVGYLHECGYYHNDVKEENFLINITSLEIKLIDFGSATPISAPDSDEFPSKLFAGTVEYKAPEVSLQKTFSLKQQEVWSMGCLLFALLFTDWPFVTVSSRVNIDVSAAVQKMGEKHDIFISEEAEFSLAMMLVREPENRIQFENIRELPIFTM